MAKHINRAKSSLAKNAMPDIVGLTRTNAETLLTALGFKYTERSTANSSPSNDESLVRGQDITPGTVVPLNTSVEVGWYQFGFTPFGFTPFSFGPFFYFTAFSFTPGSKYCVDQDTPVLVVGENDSVIEVPAEKIKIGDEIWCATFDEYIDESKDGYQGYLYTKSLTNIRMEKSTIVNIKPDTREQTIYFNEDIQKRFSLTERILVKRNDIYQYMPSGDIVVGDSFIQRNSDGSITEELITHTDILDGTRMVYRFTVEPIDHLFAGNMLVHNFK